MSPKLTPPVNVGFANGAAPVTSATAPLVATAAKLGVPVTSEYAPLVATVANPDTSEAAIAPSARGLPVLIKFAKSRAFVIMIYSLE